MPMIIERPVTQQVRGGGEKQMVLRELGDKLTSALRKLQFTAVRA